MVRALIPERNNVSVCDSNSYLFPPERILLHISFGQVEEDLRLFVLFVFRRKQRLGLTTKNSDVFYGYCLVEIVNVQRVSFSVFSLTKSAKNGNKKQSDTQ